MLNVTNHILPASARTAAYQKCWLVHLSVYEKRTDLCLLHLPNHYPSRISSLALSCDLRQEVSWQQYLEMRRHEVKKYCCSRRVWWDTVPIMQTTIISIDLLLWEGTPFYFTSRDFCTTLNSWTINKKPSWK